MTIVVIGHGRSPEGKHWGSRIDECSTVVRMWDWFPWQRSPDYGLRYDYGLFVLTPKQLGIFKENNQCEPRFGWIAYVGKPTSGLVPPRTELVDPTQWCEQAMNLGGAGLTGRLTLTRGTVAAAWAIEQRKPNKVVLVGFDNVWLGTNQPIEEAFSPDYWKLYMDRFAPDAEKVYPTGQPKTNTHDMAVERCFLENLAEVSHVELRFAQEVW